MSALETSNQSVAYLVIFHGSHDPRSQIAADSLTQSFRDKVQCIQHVSQALGKDLIKLSGQSSFPSIPNLSPLVEPSEKLDRSDASGIEHLDLAQIPVQAVYLECHPLPLHEQISLFADRMKVSFSRSEAHSSISATCSIDRLVVLPAFLLPGIHVTEDIPAEIRLATQLLGPDITIEVTPHLGSHSGLRRILMEQMATVSVEAWILLAHGSRRPGANQAVERLAESLGAVAAYWSVMPDLSSCLQKLMSCGFRRIGVIPFFLFPGGMFDAIAQTISQISQQFPDLHLTLVDPLNASPQLADLLIDLAQDQKF